MIIDSRYNGPPGTANGGYTAGLIAAYVDSPTGVDVTLRTPPPLATRLTVRNPDNGVEVSGVEVSGVEVSGPDGIVATARPVELALDELVPPVPFAEAVIASAGYRGLATHPFATCFVCGPARDDGLRLFPGPLTDGRTATPWRVPAGGTRPDTTGRAGEVGAELVWPELVWAALDCPGGWAVPMEDRPYVLGRIAARIVALPAGGDECVVMGAMVGEEGRRAYAHTTLYSPAGAVLAHARATWVALRRPST